MNLVRSVRLHRITVSHRTTWLVVEVTTSDGVTGLGECSDVRDPDLAETILGSAIETVKGFRVGDEVAALDTRLAECVPTFPGVEGVFTRLLVLGAIATALADAAARSANLPLWAWLGGSRRPSVPLYANINRAPLERTPGEFARIAMAAVEDGFDRIKWLEVSSRLSWWARDFFVSGTEDDGEPVAMLHHSDHYRVIQGPADGNGPKMLDALRTLLPVRTLDTRARLEGGAVVAGARHVFITPTVCQNAVIHGKFEDWPDFLTYLRKLYGRPVVVLDVPLGPPWEHADLYLTPIGEKTVLLGDSTLAASLLDKSAAEQLAGFSVRLAKFGSHKTGYPRLERTDASTLKAWLRRNPDPVTRRLLRQLGNLGYLVEPLPWLVFQVPGARHELRLTYNNVIMESRKNQRTVYLPKYGLADIDRAARATYERYGYRVVSIDALGPALFGGSVRCLSQVFRR